MSLQMSTPTPLLPAVAAANGAPGSDPVAEGSQDFATVLGGMLPQSGQPGQPAAIGSTAAQAVRAPRGMPAGIPALTTDPVADPALAVAVDAAALIGTGAAQTPTPAGEIVGSDETTTDASLPVANPADAAAAPASPLFALFAPAVQALSATSASATAHPAGDSPFPSANILSAGKPGAMPPVAGEPAGEASSTLRPTDAMRSATGFAAKAKEAGQSLAIRPNASQSETAAASVPTPAPAPAQPAERALSALPTQAAAMPQASPTQPAAVFQAAAPVVVDVPAPLGTRLWQQQVGQQVVWVTRQEQQSAEIRINPPDLGPVELRVTLDAQSGSQQAVLHFASPHAEVREALQNALPQLREAMAEAGIALGNATVGSESFREQSAAAQAGTAANRGGPSGDDALPGADAATASPTRRGNGLVDVFA